jgi:hypothetical protein
MAKPPVTTKGFTIKRSNAPSLCNSLAVSNEGFKDFVILDFLYSPVIHQINSNLTNHNVDVSVISSVMLPSEVAKHLHQALTEYLENYVEG